MINRRAKKQGHKHRQRQDTTCDTPTWIFHKMQDMRPNTLVAHMESLAIENKKLVSIAVNQ